MHLRTISALAAVIATLLLTATTASAAEVVVVSPGHMHGWAFWNDNDPPGQIATGHMVEGPGDPPLGEGSAELSVTGPGDRQALGTLAYGGVMLKDITTLSYWTYQTDPSHAMPFQFDVRYHPNDTGYQGRLVFEPGNGNPGGASRTWQPWSPMSGQWWASKTTAAGSNGQCGQNAPCTWAQVQQNWPNASINGAVLFKAGGGWPLPWTGNVDAFTIGVASRGVTTYDFEPCGDEGDDCEGGD
jgi:hypothetical protein